MRWLILIISRRRLAAKNIRVMRTMLFGYIETREEFDYYTHELFQLLGSGQLKTKVHKVYPLEETAQAHIVRAFIPSASSPKPSIVTTSVVVNQFVFGYRTWREGKRLASSYSSHDGQADVNRLLQARS